MLRPTTAIQRWPSTVSVLACCVAAAISVAVDALFSAREGYLARPPWYDGAGYVFFARSDYELLRGLHLHTLYDQLINAITPGWNAAIAFQYLIFGPGAWQAFTVRFWPVALLLILVYWIVSRRTSRSVAILATTLTALLPMISAGVRSSSLEYVTSTSNYLESWYLDDLRPDIFAIALVLWSVAVLAEHGDAPSRSTYAVSAVFAVLAVLMKPSTSPLLLLVWGLALAVVWWRNRRRAGATLDAAIGVAILAVLLVPWATLGGGVSSVVSYLYSASVTYGSVYGTSDNIAQRFGYFVVRIPTDLGPVEGWLAIAAAIAVTAALVRRRLGWAELIYGGVAAVTFLTFSLPTTRNTHLPEWTSMTLWVYAWAGIARLAASWRWPANRRPEPAVLAAAALYSMLVLGLGVISLAAWPANEHAASGQQLSVTAALAQELDRRITAADCFVASPGPGWPASLQSELVKSRGEAPGTIPIDPSAPPTAYVRAATGCAAVITFREDVSEVAQAFIALPPYWPYYRAIDQWVRSPSSGYTLDQSWQFTDLPPYVEHPLGRYQGVSLTVDLFVRGPAHS